MSRNIDEVELGKFLGSVDIISLAFRVASETCSTYELLTSPSGIQILAFSTPAEYTTRFLNGEFKLVSSQNHKVVDFISFGEVNSSFSINEAAVKMFETLPSDLNRLEKKLIELPLVVTGRGLGGYAAVLFALWLHHAVDVQESEDDSTYKRPVCITFGCPLVGDEGLQCIISKYPQWESRFLNVVVKDECFYSSINEYRPFGTLLFCSESGERAAFQDQHLILAVLNKMGSSKAENIEKQDYGKCLRAIRRKTLYRGVSESGEFNKLEYFDDPFGKMKEKQTKKIYDHKGKLNDMKIKMAIIEGYMKITRSESGGGIYEFYRYPVKREDIEMHNDIIGHIRGLTKHWEWFVEETRRKPQKEDAKMRQSWLLNGHNYRRMIEPLIIAEHYRNGNRNYIAQRSSHFFKLEMLLKKEVNPSYDKNTFPSLTMDSCFMAHVEEALISLSNLKREDSRNNTTDVEQLDTFEAYVMGEFNNNLVSRDVFLMGSSFMKWWGEYKTYKGSSYASQLPLYMNNGSYNDLDSQV